MSEHGDHDYEPAQDEDRPDPRPYFCLPYWTTPLQPGGRWDTGQLRPLPSPVISWLSPAIKAGPYQPGEPLDVAVEVRNSGDGNSASIGTVVVYWADPTVGFTKPEFFGAATVSVPPTRTTALTVSTPTIRRIIPQSAPDHICLLAAIHHPQDRAGVVCDPIGDRHWAQRNLTAATAQPGAPAMIPFNFANPTADDGEFTLLVRRAEISAAEWVSREMGVEALSETPYTLALHDVDGRALTDRMERLAHHVSLTGSERARIQLAVEPQEEPPSDRAIVAEAVLMAQDERPVGSLGFVVRGG